MRAPEVVVEERDRTAGMAARVAGSVDNAHTARSAFGPPETTLSSPNRGGEFIPRGVTWRVPKEE